MAPVAKGHWLSEQARLKRFSTAIAVSPTADDGWVSPPRDKRPARKPNDWVSKTDLISFLRCPYAWWQVDQGLLSLDEIFGPLEEQLLADGSAFHEEVGAMALPTPEEADLGKLLTTDVKLLEVPGFENAELMIRGIPDGIDTASGALRPIEIKSHKDVRRSDELELAFYWMLLEPHRSRQLAEPSGILILRREGEPVQIEVPLVPRRFVQVEALLTEIRKARRRKSGVRPRICGCAACSGPLREHIARRTHQGKDLTLLLGISRSHAEAFEAIGIRGYDDLLACDAAPTKKTLHDAGTYLSVAQIEQMRAHARSYQEGRPIVFGTAPPMLDSFIAWDLEYDTWINGLIWLVGLMLVEGDRFEHHAIWTEHLNDERQSLETLARVLADTPDLPILTWSGTSADLPTLKKACARHGLKSLLADVEARHVDLYEYARCSLRLPIPELKLAEVADFFGIAKTSRVSGGMQAQMMYVDYQNSDSQERRDLLKAELVAYNRDDLEALVETLRAIEGLPIDAAKAGRSGQGETRRWRRFGAQEASVSREVDDRAAERPARIERENDREREIEQERDLDRGFGIE